MSDEREINLSRMSPADRQAAWAYLRAHNPGLAALLQDPIFQDMRTQMNGEVLVPASALPERFRNA